MERRDTIELNQTLDFLVRILELAPGETVFDQCCGFGSLSVPLAERGFNLIGVDLCQKYIDKASNSAKLLSGTNALSGTQALGGTKVLAGAAQFHCADAFTFSPSQPCDAAFNWYTSFGYSDDDNVNVKMLERAFESLKPGRKFALEYPNIADLLRNFKARFSYSRETESGTIMVKRRCWIDAERGVMLQRWNHKLPDGRELENNTSLRLYLPHTLADLFKRAGFTDIKLLGGIDGSELRQKSARCIVVGTKPKH
jgi:SAM-dependent methyltransferase